MIDNVFFLAAIEEMLLFLQKYCIHKSMQYLIYFVRPVNNAKKGLMIFIIDLFFTFYLPFYQL